jgi:hypothetical protein
LKDPEYVKAGEEEFNEELLKARVEMNKSYVKLVIDSVFSSVTAAIAAYHLLGAVGWI